MDNNEQEMEVEDMDGESSEDEIPEESIKKGDSQSVYLPGRKLEEGEELIADESAYVMLHTASTGSPCLSFDIIPDELGTDRENYPLSCYIVAGTQAPRTHLNNLIVIKMTNLYKTQQNSSDDEDDTDEELEDSDDESNPKSKVPQMNCALIKHQGCVNRVRSKKLGNSIFAASWSELGKVNIWNLSQQLQAVDDTKLLSQYEKQVQQTAIKPVFTFTGHQQEGYAVDWSPIAHGGLATGDCRRDIHIWSPLPDGSWKVDQRPLVGHTQSVEDLQWSPTEKSVLASCSVDKTIRIWDVRSAPQKACMLTCDNAHEHDINVISWNRTEPFIASGGDDGFLHIWDLRQFQSKKPVATFKHHTNHITTVEWNPKDSTVLASGGDDNQIALWDLAVEKDVDENMAEGDSGVLDNEGDINKLPPQLLFIHQGQQEIKELHWHPQLPGVILSTALSGFNVFRTISV